MTGGHLLSCTESQSLGRWLYFSGCGWRRTEWTNVSTEVSNAISAIASALLLVGVGAFFSLWVHRAAGNRALTMGLYIVFGAFGFFLFLFGLGSIFRDWREGNSPETSSYIALLIGTIAALTLVPSLRAMTARVIPFDPTSWPATIGLYALAALGVVSAFSLFGSDDTGAISYFALALTAAAEVALAFVVVGFGFHRNRAEAMERLGLHRPTGRQVLIALGLVIVTFAVSALSSYLVQILQPDLHEQITRNMEEMTSKVQSVWGALALGLAAGIGEEILFRGAIQPRFGIVFTALIFALLHQQYGPSLITVGAFASGIIFGLQRKHMGTVPAIITHAVYNTIAVLLIM